MSSSEASIKLLFEEFDPSSGLTLAVCLIHASRAPWTLFINFIDRVQGAADGRVTRWYLL